MTHIEFIKTGAAERYVLREMTDEERDRFEEHFFSCDECAQDMRSLNRMIDGIRAMEAPATQVEAARTPSRISQWLASVFQPRALGFAAAALAGVVFYQSLIVIPELRERSFATGGQASFALLRPEVRGSAREVARAAGQAAVVGLDIPVAPATAALEAIVHRTDEQVAARIPVTLPAGESRVFVVLPSTLTDGAYRIDLNAGGTEVGRYSLQLSTQTR